MSSISNTWSYGTSASASSTFMCPGMRPATGWMAYLTVTPLCVRFSATSLTACAGAAPLDAALPLLALPRPPRLAAEAAEDDVEERAVHRLAHDVREDGAR